MPRRSLSNTYVRKMRERVAVGESILSICEESGLRYNLVRRIIRGTTYKDAGGPIFPNVHGQMLRCTRCNNRRHRDTFEFVRNAQNGICKECAKPEDKFLRLAGPEQRSADIRARHDEKRAELRAQIEAMMAEPLAEDLITDEDREAIRTAVKRKVFAI